MTATEMRRRAAPRAFRASRGGRCFEEWRCTGPGGSGSRARTGACLQIGRGCKQSWKRKKIMNSRSLLILAGLAASACAQNVANALASAPPTVAARPSAPHAIVPAVDYHQHLVSPAGAEWINRPRASVKDLPQEIAALLQQRSQRWNDRHGLAQLYTADSLILRTYNPEWIRGRAAIAEYVSTTFARAHRLTPLTFAMVGGEAHISGYFSRGEPPSTSHFGHFYLRLKREADAWRIAVETPFFPLPPQQPPVTSAELIALLDGAGIKQAVVHSVAYMFGESEPGSNAPDEYRKVQAENDWTADQVARHPGRLAAFCSFNPLKDYALAELERCASSGRFDGLKLHFGSSSVNLKNPDHLAKLRSVFVAANRRALPITIHARGDRDYGREHAVIFLEALLPAAPDVPVQIAHLWGGEAFTDAALAVYAEAIARKLPGTKNLYFDVADVAHSGATSEAALQTLTQRIRQIGTERILFGSDALGPNHPAPREAWKAFREIMPLTDAELRAIADNVLPYLN